MFKYFIIIAFLISMSGCSYLNILKSNKSITAGLKYRSSEFILKDKAGKFLLKEEKGFSDSKKEYIVKKQVIAMGKGKILEKSITISTFGSLGKKINILRPYKSEYTVWFDGKKYISKMKINTVEKQMEVNLESPEPQWQGRKVYDFPKEKRIFCYYSQIIDCAKVGGFIKNAEKNNTGKMKVYIVWEGFPYFQEQYINIPNTVFSRGLFEYDGKNKDGELRFTLNVSGQSIFYLLNRNYEHVKTFWVSQGLTVIRNK